MHRFLTGQILVHLVGNEWRERRYHLGDPHQYLIGSGIHCFLIVVQLLSPESPPGSSDIPVGKVLTYEFLYLPHGFHVVIPVHVLRHFFYQAVILRYYPSVQFRSLIISYFQGCRIQLVLIGIQREEIIHVLQRSEKLADYLHQPIFIELGR